MTTTRKYLPREERNFTIIRLPITYRKSYLLSATVMGRFYELPNYRWLDVTFRILQVKFNIGSKTLSVKIACNYKLKGLVCTRNDWWLRHNTSISPEWTRMLRGGWWSRTICRI